MKSRKNRNNITKKNRKGGFLFGNSKVVPSSEFGNYKVLSSSECDFNNLSTLTKMPEVYDMNGQLKSQHERMNDLDNMIYKLRENYNKCCPKGFMGKKNSSPYCKQLDTTFKSIQQHKQNISGYYGDETDVGKIKEVMNAPVPSPYVEPQKPWYKFWGGKKTRKHRKSRKHKKTSHRIK